jgi:bla regulator protein blaR1
MIVPLSIVAKATLVMVVALAAVRGARHAPAAMRHLVLASAFAVLAALPWAELAVPSFNLVSIGRPQAALALGPIVMAADTVRPAATAPAPATPARRETTGASAPSLAARFAAAWSIGAAICLVPVLITPWRLRRMRRSARPWADGEALVRTLASDAARRSVAVRIHDDVSAPLTCGVRRPVIVMPSDAPRWSDEDVRRALVHELEHIRRADWLVHVSTRIVCALYWFHPLTWIAWQRLCLESERACDDAVLRVAEGTAYAQQLVTLARRHSWRSPVPGLSMVNRSDLSARIAAVLDDTQLRGRVGAARASAIIAAATLLVAAVAPLGAARQAQSSSNQAVTARAFDVVSIKENKSGNDGSQMMRRQPGRVVANNFPVRPIILNAFGLQPHQLAGGPDWLDSARYDINAQFSGDIPVTEPGTVGPLQLMMQRLLAERFTLVVHPETRELPIYTLILARSDGRLGPQIRTAATDCEAVMNEMLKRARETGTPPGAGPQLPDGRPGCGMRYSPDGQLRAGGTSMAALARNLSGGAGRIVVDRTGLKGGFDFELEFAPDAVPAPGGTPPAAPDSNRPSMFTALDEQLGLKLQPDRGPVEVLVIDRVERPTEN